MQAGSLGDAQRERFRASLAMLPVRSVPPLTPTPGHPMGPATLPEGFLLLHKALSTSHHQRLHVPMEELPVSYEVP